MRTMTKAGLIAAAIALAPLGIAHAEDEPTPPPPVEEDQGVVDPDYAVASSPAFVDPPKEASAGPVPVAVLPAGLAAAADLPVTGSEPGLQLRNALAAVAAGIGLVIVAGFRRRATRATVRSV